MNAVLKLYSIDVQTACSRTDLIDVDPQLRSLRNVNTPVDYLEQRGSRDSTFLQMYLRSFVSTE